MKYYIYFFLLFLVGGCKKLDLVPKDNQTAVNFFKTADDLKSAVGAVYAQLTNGMYGGEGILFFIDLVTTDDAIPFLTGDVNRPLLWRYQINPSNNFVNVYFVNYTAIQRANIVIENSAAVPMDATLKSRFIGEAKFIRALAYFNLVRLYGGVPIVTKVVSSLDDLDFPRASVQEVYALIESDLKEAEMALPVTYTGADRGRATKGAAKGLLAQVYLTRAGNKRGSAFWAQAATKAKEVIDLGVYELWANFADAFSLSNKAGKESVFEVQFVTDVRGHNMGRGYGVRSAPIYPVAGSGIARVSPSLWNAYSGNDTRRAFTVISSYTYNGVTTTLSLTDPDPTKGYYIQKLWDKTAKTSGGEGTSIPVMRYADVLLMYAEALNEANNGPDAEAYQAYKKVHERAGLTTPALQTFSYQSFREAVWLERRLELVCENQRRFDLVRTGRLIEAVKSENTFNRNAAIQPFHMLLPIPQAAIDANPKLVQNEGY